MQHARAVEEMTVSKMMVKGGQKADTECEAPQMHCVGVQPSIRSGGRYGSSWERPALSVSRPKRRLVWPEPA